MKRLSLFIFIAILIAAGCQSETEPQNVSLSSQNAEPGSTEGIRTTSNPVQLSAQGATPTPVGLVVVQGGNNMGPVQSFTLPEVIMRTGIRAWHEAGWTGRGQRIGVLDLGFGGLANFKSSFATSVTLMPGEDSQNYNSDTLSHGTEVLEVIHAMAPNAELYACRYAVFDEFVGCIDWFITAGVRIVNHSAGVPALPLDGSNVWALQVDRMAREGVLWVNAAGNYAGGFVSNVFTDTNTNSYHEFWGSRGLQETLGVKPIEARQGFVMLSWEGIDDTPANAIDLDLEIIDEADQIITSSNLQQRGYPGDTALEWVSFEMNRIFGVRIRDVSGNGAGVRFALFIEFASIPSGNTQGSVIAPGDSQNALTIGALQGRIIAPYSSQGPVGSGAIKPDLVAPGEIVLDSGTLFVGTSAAAPVVSGLAALVWEENPTFSREEIYGFIRDLSIQDDSFIAGSDNVYGHGYVYMPLPQTTAGAPSPTSTSTVAPLEAVSTPPSTLTNVPASLTPTLTFTTNTPATEGNQPTAIVNVASANLRSGPGTNYDIVGRALQGEQFPVIAQAYDNTWYLISQPNGEQAWIAASTIRVEPDDEMVEPVATIPPTSEHSVSAGNGFGGLFEGDLQIVENPSDYYEFTHAPGQVTLSLTTDPIGTESCYLALFFYYIKSGYNGNNSISRIYNLNQNSVSQTVVLPQADTFILITELQGQVHPIPLTCASSYSFSLN